VAKVGLKHIVGAKLSESAANASYTNGMNIGKAIAANITVEVNNVILYADDSVAENVIEFKSGKVSLNTDDMTFEVQGMLLGHTATATTLKANANDVAPYVGIGFYGSVVRSGVTKYRAIWLYKIKFAEGNDETKTKGESIEFTTPTIEGTLLKMPNGDWKEEALFTKEDEAIAWINEKAGITEGTVNE
jgi:phi13 family phage major tail protein